MACLVAKRRRFSEIPLLPLFHLLPEQASLGGDLARVLHHLSLLQGRTRNRWFGVKSCCPCCCCCFVCKKTIQLSLGLKLPLDTYLLKPVQRISKYQLLLKESLKCCAAEEKKTVEQALESMLEVVNNLNDVMHASFIVGSGCSELKSQGRLLKRDQLQMSKLKRNAKQSVVNRLKLSESSKFVEVFLFEKALIICKRKADDPSNHHASTLSSAAHNLSSVSSSMIAGSGSSGSSASSSSSSSCSTTSSSFHHHHHHPSLMSSNSASLSSQSSIPFASTQFPFQYFYQFKELIKVSPSFQSFLPLGRS